MATMLRTFANGMFARQQKTKLTGGNGVKLEMTNGMIYAKELVVRAIFQLM